LRRIDTAPAAMGRIHVHELQHAVAEELAQVLTQMLSGAAPRGQQPGQASADMFEGEVRVTADKATNSLVVTSSGRDFAQLRLVIEKLDMPRRQVFIEAVIMDVSVDRMNQFGLAYHGGTTADLGGGSDTIFIGGFRPINSVVPTASDLQGLALGARGPELENTTNAFPALAGVSIPAFGVVLNALATSGDANILATPHIIATDNVQAEINVGENIPLQENFAGAPNPRIPGVTSTCSTWWLPRPAARLMPPTWRPA
jgi:general secretion pathway protein D